MQKNNLTISVRDSGIGIPHRKQKEIFEPFRQLESSEARRHGGTGLGLAISQRMLKILGGKIEVQSKVGEGTRFEICVPTQVDTSKPAKRKRTRSSIGSKSKTTKKTKTTSGILNRTKRHWKNGKPQVLVVEDDENTRYAMQFILEDEGYDVVFAEGGEEALTAAQHRQPDIILMDIMMPNMDGYQVSRALKSQKQLAKIPVVALTARAMKGDREKALAAGCDDYLTKPFEKKDILKMIEKWTRN